MKFKQLILQSLSHFDIDCFRVVKIKDVPVLRVYFNGDFVAGIVIQCLSFIEGLNFVGVNTDEKYLFFTY